MPRAYTMSIGFYGSDDRLMCLPHGFADLKYIEKRIVFGSMAPFHFIFHPTNVARHTKYSYKYRSQRTSPCTLTERKGKRYTYSIPIGIIKNEGV